MEWTNNYFFNFVACIFFTQFPSLSFRLEELHTFLLHRNGFLLFQTSLLSPVKLTLLHQQGAGSWGPNYHLRLIHTCEGSSQMTLKYKGSVMTSPLIESDSVELRAPATLMFISCDGYETLPVWDVTLADWSFPCCILTFITGDMEHPSRRSWQALHLPRLHRRCSRGAGLHSACTARWPTSLPSFSWGCLKRTGRLPKTKKKGKVSIRKERK